MIVVWIVIGIGLLGLAGWAFWPTRRGVVDSEVRQLRRHDRARIENYNNHQ